MGPQDDGYGCFFITSFWIFMNWLGEAKILLLFGSIHSFFILYNIVMSLQFWWPTWSNFMVLAWPLHILLLHNAHLQIFYIWSLLLISFIWSMQLFCMEQWALLDRDHSNSLSGAIEALKASTLRLPVIGGARVSTLIFKKCRVQFTYEEI